MRNGRRSASTLRIWDSAMRARGAGQNGSFVLDRCTRDARLGQSWFRNAVNFAICGDAVRHTLVGDRARWHGTTRLAVLSEVISTHAPILTNGCRVNGLAACNLRVNFVQRLLCNEFLRP